MDNTKIKTLLIEFLYTMRKDLNARITKNVWFFQEKDDKIQEKKSRFGLQIKLRDKISNIDQLKSNSAFIHATDIIHSFEDSM